MAFTEFYTDYTNGSNLYAGSTTGAPVTTLTGGTWVQSTRVFTKAGANLSGVSVGMFASVYADGASAPTGFVGRISAVDDGADTITIHATASFGTAPVDGTTNTTLVVGGVWKGPDGASGFPFGSIANTITNASGDLPFVNMKNNAAYSISAAMTHGNAQGFFQGYSSTVRDGGKASITSTGTASFVLLSVTGARSFIADIIFDGDSFTTGTSDGITTTAAGIVFRGLVIHHVRNDGIDMGSGANGSSAIECEVYACNEANTANRAGISADSSANIIKCISHDNTGSNTCGFITTTSSGIVNSLYGCIADTNGLHGFHLRGRAAGVIMRNCDSYNNGGAGATINSTTSGCGFIFENNNFIKNGTYGIEKLDSLTDHTVVLLNNGFGAGTQANTSGTIESDILNYGQEIGSVTYASNVTPWVDPANGDFRINLSTAINAGRGSFTQTAASYAGTIGYPDIGAAQHLESASGGGLIRHPGMSGGLNA